MELLVVWGVMALAIIITAFVLPGVQVGLISAIVTAVVLGLLNTFVKPIIVFLTLPVNILTLGLFTLIINAFLIYIAGIIVPGFRVSSFWMALAFSIVLSIVQVVLSRVFFV